MDKYSYLTLDEYKSDVNKLHELITAGDCNTDNLEEIINRYKDERYFSINDSESRISAAGAALKYSRLKIYEFLLSKNILLKEAMKDIKQQMHNKILDDNRKKYPKDTAKIILYLTGEERNKIIKEIRNVHDKFVKESTPKHIANLISKTKFKHDNNNDDFIQIVQIFKSLNSIKEIEIILKVISTCPDVTIELDVDHNSVEHMVPSVGHSTEGLTCVKQKKIYVGAKEWFMEGGLKYKTLGTLAHELCHYAMQLVYGNDSKPYTKADDTKKVNFGKIVLLMKALNEKENSKGVKEIGEIIQNVYKAYGNNLWHDELIVRVPHILALYSDDVRKRKYCKKIYAQLFKFFQENTLSDLHREYPLMEAKRELCALYGSLQTADNDLTPEGLKIDLGANGKNLFITSNCPHLTINAIYYQTKKNVDFEPVIIADAKTFENYQNFELAMKTTELCTKPKLIIDCDGIATDEVMKIVAKFHDKEVKMGIVIISSNKSLLHEDYNTCEVKYFWRHLTLNFQEKLLESKISFQGVEKKVGDILKDLNMIESIPFKELLGEQQMIIGEDLTKKGYEEFVERKFLPPTYNPEYRPPNLIKPGEDVKHEFEDVLNVALSNQSILLSDDPGTGKSVSITMIQLKLKEKYPARWIVLMDLKLHCESFQTDDEISSRFESREKLFKFMCDEILQLKNFEAELFSYLFSKDEVIILMDGLDEICPSFKKFVFELMVAIKEWSKIQLWISTRPHLMKEFDQNEILRPIVYKLDKFTAETRRDFFVKFFVARNKCDQNIGEKIERIEEFLTRLDYHSMGGFVKNPLMFKMIAECFDADENLDIYDSNLYSIYDQFTTKMINRSLYKGPDGRLSAAKAYGDAKIVDFYQKIAFKDCFNPVFFEKFFSQIINICFQDVATPSSDDIRSVGLLISEGSDSFHFIHRTFAEFYVAKYFYEQIFCGKFKAEIDLRALVEFFVDGLTRKSGEFELIIALVEKALEPFKAADCKRTAKPILGNIVERKSTKFLMLLIRGDHFHLLKSFLYHLVPTPRKHLLTNIVWDAIMIKTIVFIEPLFRFLEEIFDQEEMKKVLLEQDDENRNILQIAASNSRCYKIFNFLVQKVETTLGKNDLINLLMHTNQRDENIFHRILQRTKDVKNALDTVSQILNHTQLQALLSSKVKNENILHFPFCFMGPNFENAIKLQALWDLMKIALDKVILQDILLEKTKSNNKIVLEMASTKELEVFQNAKKFYIETFSENELQEIVVNLAKNKDILFGRFLENDMPHCKINLILHELLDINQYKKVLKEILQLENENGDTLFMFAARNQDNRMFLDLIPLLDALSFEDQNEILMQKNKFDECALHCSSSKNVSFVKNFYQKRVNDQNMAALLTGGSKEFFIMLLENETSEVESFCLQVQKMFQESDKMEKLRSFFLSCDEEGYTEGYSIFTNAAGMYTTKAFELLFGLSKKLFDDEKVKEILMKKTKKGITAFHESIYVEKGSVFEYVKNVYHDFLGPDEMKKLVLSEVDDGNILSYCSIFSSYRDRVEKRDEDEPFTFKLLFDYLKELLSDFDSKSSMKKIFMSYKNNSIRNEKPFLARPMTETPLTFIAEHCDFEMLSAYSSLLETFSEEEQIEILMQTNDSGKCALQCGALHPETLFFLKNLYKAKVGEENLLKIILNGGKKFILDYIGKETFKNPTEAEEFCTSFDNLFKDSEPREKLKDLFLTCDDDGENILMSATKLRDIKAFETLFILCIKLFDAKKLEEILLLKGKDEATALHFAIKKDEKKKFLTVINVYLQTLGKEKMKEMLWTAFDGENLMFYAIETMKQEILEFFRFFMPLLVGEEVKLDELASIKNKNGETLAVRLKKLFKPWIIKEILLLMYEARWPVKE